MPSSRPVSLVLLSIGLLAGCKPGAPYSDTLAVEATTRARATSTAWRVVESAVPGAAGDPLEQKGVLGTGENCVIAGQSSGTYTSDIVYEKLDAFNVVGQTWADLPLVPGEREEFSEVAVSVVKESSRIGSYVRSTETFVDPSAEVPEWEETRYQDQQVVTDAGFHGVAADEYLVRLEMASLWDDLKELDRSSVQLLTRHEPEEGDVWPSTNGNTLYVYAGEEDLSLANVEMKKADKVEAYTTGSINPGLTAAVYEQCLNLGLDQVQTTQSEVESTSLDRVFLDPGCVGDFTHVKEGTEWWYGNVLVKAETFDTLVTITDYGFEWCVQDDDAGLGTRMTSPTRDDPSARLFVQYTVTRTEVLREVTSFVE